MEEIKNSSEKKSSKNYFDMGEVLTYFFRKKDPNNKPNLNLRMMHGINKISIIIFIMAFIFWLIKRII